MRMLKRIKVPLLLAVLVLIPFWDLLWLPSNQAIAGNDLDFMFLQWWRFSLESIRNGELPLWNPQLFSGTPFVANPQPGLFYPPVWLTLAFPLARVASWLVVLHLWLAGLGMYGWLRSEEIEEKGALLGAIVYAFCGYFSVRVFAGHLGVVMTQAWLPAMLWAYHAALKRRQLAGAVLAGLLVALSLLGGHTASFLYVVLILGAYALYCAWQDWQQKQAAIDVVRPLSYLAVMLLAGLGLAAVQFLPTWELVQLSTRQETTYAFAADHSWPPGHLVTLFIPSFFGEPGRIGYWGGGVYEELIFYVGVLPLVLIMAIGIRKLTWHRLIRFLLVLAGVGLLTALGQYGILHRLIYNFLPLFRATRAPARAGFLFVFATSALAGVLLACLKQEPEKARAGLRSWVWEPFPWLVVALTTLVVLAGFMVFALQRDTNPDVGRLWHVANNSALFLFFFILTVVLMRAWYSGQLDSRQGVVLAIGLVLLDLWGFSRYMIQPVSLGESAYWRIVTEITAGGEGRVLPWGLGIFEHNKGMRWDLESVFGYDPLELERYSRFITAVPDPQARAYDLLHARYLITTHEADFPDRADAPQLVDQRDGVWVYERPTALPPAWLVHQVEVHDEDAGLNRLNDPAFDPWALALLEQSPSCELAEPTGPENVQFYRLGNNRVEVDVNASAGGLLVLSEVFYPGWRAMLDGEPVPILQTDYVLRGICVPPGRHHVVFSFSPASLQVGAVITFLSLLVLGGASFWVWRERSR